MRAFVGLDVGAISTNLAILDPEINVVGRWYLRTEAAPIESVRRILELAHAALPKVEVVRLGTTGSGRHLAAALAGADIAKNEITAHAAGTLHFFPDARTIIEIGGQDSKIILLKDGRVVDFAMNTVCAAGTGSFLDHQAARMGMSIEEFAELAARSERGVRIAGRCAVFAETDIIEKQQRGAERREIARGLCESLVRNFLAGVASGKTIAAPVIFQGGVAGNHAVRRAFESELGTDVRVPDHYDVMGAIGAAILARSEAAGEGPSRFKGFAISSENLATKIFECTECPNSCEILEIFDGTNLISRWGSRCGRWDIEE
jgi:predicted CoA-substrate-specific enzyme activase